MFFSKVVLFAVSLGALSVLATPHALHHHALHRRALAARVAPTNATVAGKRQNSQKCNHHHAPASSPEVPASSSNVPASSSNVPAIPATTTPQNAPPTPATTPTPTSTQPQPPPAAPTSTNPSLIATPPSTGDDGQFGGIHGGDGTFFETGLGACGKTNTDSDHIVAVSELLFDNFPGIYSDNPNFNPVCFKQVSITGPNGQTATATVTDRCTGCAVTDLDMTPSLFTIFAPQASGRIHITWNFID